jgi:hypothetical protein
VNRLAQRRSGQNLSDEFSRFGSGVIVEQWQYTVVDKIYWNNVSRQQLDDLGAKGWEAVGFSTSPRGELSILLKRRLPPK